jgi:quinol monooxygenase YgiN
MATAGGRSLALFLWLDGDCQVTRFLQIIELKTTRVDEVRSLVAEMRAETGYGGALRGTVTKDRDRPGYYFTIMEFASYESAIAYSERPDVSAYAMRLASLCEEPPRFHNHDVMETWNAAANSAAPPPAAGRSGLTSTAAGVAGVAASSVATGVTTGVAAGVARARELLQDRRTTR